MTRPPTAKERVLKVHPKAECYLSFVQDNPNATKFRRCWAVYKTWQSIKYLSTGKTQTDAWSNAAANLKGRKK